MDIDRIFTFLEHNGPYAVGMFFFAFAFYKLGMEFLATYKERLKLADERDAQRIATYNNLVETQKEIVADNKKINENQMKTADLLLSHCKYKAN